MFIKRGITPVAILCLAASTALFGTSAVAQEKTQVATVNGQPVTQEQLFAYARITAPQANLQDQNVRTQLLQAFLGRELMYQEALKQKIDQQPGVQAALEETRHALLAQAYVSRLIQEKPVTEAMAHEVYDKQIATQKGVEYHARHILVPNEDDAKGAINRLRKGEDFAKLAQSVSKDSSATRGGDLGWLSPEKMPPAFAEALTQLKPGKYTTAPVKTDYGWHVVYMEANRPSQPPPFEAVRDQLMKAMQDQIVNQHLGELQKRAKIDLIKK